MKRTKARTRAKREADPVRCAYCKATGKDPNAFLYFRPCPVCKGKGWVRPELPRRGYEERVMEAYDRRYAEHAGPPGALASFYAEVLDATGALKDPTDCSPEAAEPEEGGED